jgi:hypothetical protein
MRLPELRLADWHPIQKHGTSRFTSRALDRAGSDEERPPPRAAAGGRAPPDALKVSPLRFIPLERSRRKSDRRARELRRGRTQLQAQAGRGHAPLHGREDSARSADHEDVPPPARTLSVLVQHRRPQGARHEGRAACHAPLASFDIEEGGRGDDSPRPPGVTGGVSGLLLPDDHLRQVDLTQQVDGEAVLDRELLQVGVRVPVDRHDGDGPFFAQELLL